MSSLRLVIDTICQFFYRRLPLSSNTKVFIRNFLYTHLEIVFSGTRAYESFKAFRTRYPNNIDSGHLAEINDSNYFLYLPSGASGEAGINSVVDIIIPVYKGYSETKRCIESVLQSNNKTKSRIIVIDDCSPDHDLVTYLNSLEVISNILVIHNSTNQGFAATVNRGMSLSSDNDVVLLNSDTEVANNWLDKLASHAYSAINVGTVTPFSNNATICNYPNLAGFQIYSDDGNTAHYDRVFKMANYCRSIRIPTGVGFCMFITRNCLNSVGNFDMEAFGKGYGEENDFCMRAKKHGFTNLLAADTFVYHKGEVSFGEDSVRKKLNASKVINDRYPSYEKDIAFHIKSNEIRPFIIAATAARYKYSEKPVILHVTHAYGGGTEKHIQDLSNDQLEKSKVLILRPFGAGFSLTSVDQTDDLNVTFDVSESKFLSDFLASFGVSIVHYHSLLGFSESCKNTFRGLSQPFYLTLHDYAPVCPRVNLVSHNGIYCGEPSTIACNSCLKKSTHLDVKDIIWWRECHRWLFDRAQAVICPSNDVFKRFLNYFPSAKYKVVPHEADVFTPLVLPEFSPNEPLRIAILGVLAPHKGLSLIQNVLKLIDGSPKLKAKFNFRLIGYVDGEPINVSSQIFSQTGHYLDNELLSLVDRYDPHVILFASLCPETFSFTLSAALKSGRPIIATNIGSFVDRTKGRDWVWSIPFDISAEKLIRFLEDVRLNNFSTKSSKKQLKSHKQFEILDHKFYEREYFNLKNFQSNYVDIRSPGKIIAIVVLEMVRNYPSPCAYIRLLLPLLSIRSEKFDFRVVPSESVTSYVADLLITHRIAVSDIAQIDKINDHCSKNHIKIIYDIDDYLLALPLSHPEYKFYKSKSAAVFRWIVSASKVSVSTTQLKNKLLPINSEINVVKNAIYHEFINSTNDIIQDKKNVFNILFMGTQTHEDDFNIIRPALERIKKDFSNVEIYIVGISQRPLELNFINYIEIPSCAYNYPSFITWLKNCGIQFDIGLAPLCDNTFNSCKSDIKFLDYSLLGVATIASKSKAYQSIIHLINGLLIDNDETEWYNAIKYLYLNPLILKAIRKSATSYLVEKRLISNFQSILF